MGSYTMFGERMSSTELLRDLNMENRRLKGAVANLERLKIKLDKLKKAKRKKK